MLTNAIFGRGIVSFDKKRCEELKNTCVFHIVRKMGLGNNFPIKLPHVKKSALWVGLFEPKTSMDYLEIKFHVVNKRSKDKLKIVANVHEEKSTEDSGLLKNVRRSEVKIKHWKASWR